MDYQTKDDVIVQLALLYTYPSYKDWLYSLLQPRFDDEKIIVVYFIFIGKKIFWNK